MTHLGSSLIKRGRPPAAGLCWLSLGVVLAFAICRGPHAATFARDASADASAPSRPAIAPATAPSVYNTLAVVATPAVRNSGLADLVAADLGQRLPGVRLVERGRLDAAAGELAAVTLLGADAAAGAARLKLGRLVRADALVVLAEEEAGGAPGAPGAINGNAPPTPKGDRAKASTIPQEVQLVIADCHQGARLRVISLPVDPRDPAKLSGAVAAAVRDVRAHYPDGVRWIIGTSPFVSRNLLHDYDPDQRRFAALLDNALTLQPGVAVLESEEARAIAAERAVGGDGDGVRRKVPLIVEGEFEVAGAAGSPQDAGRPTTREPAHRATVSFNVTLTDGAGGGPGRTIRRTIPLADVAAFLSQELPAAILARAPLADLKPLPADAQFKALVDRAGEFARLGAVEHSTPLREAALLLRPQGADAATQRRSLVQEYTQLTERLLVAPFDSKLRNEREQAIHDRAWEAGLDHLEYLVRNRQLKRQDAIRLLLGLRSYTGAMVLDGPPRLKRYVEEMLPLVWALPAPPEPWERRPPDQVETEDRDTWLTALVGPGSCDRLCWSGGHLMTPEGYDAVMEVIDRWAPADAYPNYGVVGLIGYLPSFKAPEYRARTDGPAPVPADGTLTGRQMERQYAAFLSRLEHCGKPGYAALARYARLYDKDIELTVRRRDSSTPEELAAFLAEVRAFQSDYLGLRLGGKPPAEQDAVAYRVSDIAKETEVMIAWKRSKAGGGTAASTQRVTHTPETSPATRPATEPAIAGAPPVADNGNRLWLVPLRVRVRSETGELVDYGTLRARDRVWAFDEHLVSGGPGQPDVLWTPSNVRFWGNDDVIEPGLTLPPGTLRLRDVKSDGQRIWAATTTEGIWVLDRRGKAVAQIGPEDGLPPADSAMFVLPLPGGRVFATGSFGKDNRGWCALIEARFDGAGRLLGRPRVEVIHKGTAVSHNTPPATRPVGTSGLSRAVLPADWSYIPSLIGSFKARDAGAGAGTEAGTGAGTGAAPDKRLGPWVLVGRAFDNDDPLVFDLSPGRPPAVSLLEVPLMLEDRPAPHRSSIWADSLLEVGSAAIARYPLTVDAAAAADRRGVLTAAREPQILCRRRWEPPERGRQSRTEIWAVLPAPDGLYALSGDCAFRIDPATFACERVGYDPELLRTGRINCGGVSDRRGPLMWGDEMCRVVIARDPPAGALEAKTVVGAEGEIRVLWSGTGPTPSGAALMQHDVRQ